MNSDDHLFLIINRHLILSSFQTAQSTTSIFLLHHPANHLALIQLSGNTKTKEQKKRKKKIEKNPCLTPRIIHETIPYSDLTPNQGSSILRNHGSALPFGPAICRTRMARLAHAKPAHVEKFLNRATSSSFTLSFAGGGVARPRYARNAWECFLMRMAARFDSNG